MRTASARRKRRNAERAAARQQPEVSARVTHTSTPELGPDSEPEETLAALALERADPFGLDLGLGSGSEPQDVLAAFVRSSRALSRRIFTRANIYVIVGVLIAFAGVLFFYLQTVGQTSEDGDLFSDFLRSAPRFGILFFVEFIAFFFLRQYRSDMEEFRYYEAVQRKREEIFALVRFMKTQDEKVDIARLAEVIGQSSTVDKLGAGESTELLETKKLTKDEMDILVKIIEAVMQSRGIG